MTVMGDMASFVCTGNGLTESHCNFPQICYNYPNNKTSRRKNHMSQHLYCCQNTIQNALDHIIEVPDDFDVNPACLYGIDKADFIAGLKTLTAALKSIYADMIESPADYGFPLVEDIEYSPFNPKAAESKHTVHRLIAILHTLVNCGELKSDGIHADNKTFTAACKPLKSMMKISNAKMIFEKLRAFGFTYDNGVFSYSGDKNAIPALYGYMRANALHRSPIFSLNYFRAMPEMPSKQFVFASYLNDSDREFFALFDEFAQSQNYVTGSAPDFRDASIEYVTDAKSEKRVARLFSDYGKLRVMLKLHSSGCYNESLETMPDKIKAMFRKESGCKTCREPCKMRLHRTFEGKNYTDCGYWNGFDIPDCNPTDIDLYKDIIKLEAKAEKTNARQKGITVTL